jgi:hypothetical protein
MNALCPAAVLRLFLGLSLAVGSAAGHAAEYLSRDDFLASAFGEAKPESRFLWLTAEQRDAARAELGWAPGALRLRYWQAGDQTAWILEDIGKEQPITLGVTVRGDAIERVEVMAFRESRGWEIRYPFFTEQFRGITLENGGDLSKPVDGITGATLSVRAVKRMARLALWLSALAAA